MRLNFTYNGELRKRLEQHAPQTHLPIHLYSTSEEFHTLFYQNERHERMWNKFSSLPDVSNSHLTSYDDIQAHFVEPLQIDSSQQRECVDKTLRSHFRKAREVPDTQLNDELTIMVARCVPLFLLEAASNYPITGLFKMKSGEVNHYLHLPRKNDYVKILT